MTQPAPRTVRWTPHYRCSWGGNIGFPAVETWSNTLRFRSDQDVLGQGAPVMDHDQLQTAAELLGPVLSGWMSDASAMISAVAQLDWVKVNWVNDQGLQPDTNTVRFDVNPRVTGTAGQTSPWHMTYALTLRTALARGRSHAGRIYPPVVSPPLIANQPYIAVADATAMATSLARVIYAMENAFNEARTTNDPDIHAIIASPGDTASGKLPLFQRVTGVVCDRVGDVMHSRNRQVPRAEGALVAPGP